MVREYQTKDSGKRAEYKSGYQRDSQDNKPRFDLMLPNSQEYKETLLYRLAQLYARGAGLYGSRNWEMANSIEELDRAKASAFRHFIQAMAGETDEDHLIAVVWNINSIVYLMDKLKVDINGDKIENGRKNTTTKDIRD